LYGGSIKMHLIFPVNSCSRVAENQTVIEDVISGNTSGCVMGETCVLQEDAGLKARPVLFPDPDEFEFLFR
jgi:hypothetical protein